MTDDIQFAVSKCPAAGQGLKWTKCPAVRNFHRISAERFFQTSSLEMQSDSKNYVGAQDDEITEPGHTTKSQWFSSDCRSRPQID